MTQRRAMILRPKHRETAVPTSSMADIAFLLLIFFLVTTTIDVDTGIAMVLPPEVDHQPPPVKERNMLTVSVRGDGLLLVEDALTPLEQLGATVERHVLNCASTYGYGCLNAYAASPAQAIVSIKTARGTSYRAYIDVLDEVWAAYHRMWDAEARALGYSDYAAYVTHLQESESPNHIRQRIRAGISLAEPDAASGH